MEAYRPVSFREALRIRSQTGALPFAGGTDLMVSGKRRSGLAPRFASPVLFISHLEELKAVEHTASHLRIGAAASLASLLEHEALPAIMRPAIAGMASCAIRNLATVGGNICNASPAGDTLPALYVLDAEVILESEGEERRLRLDEFITGPGETALRDDEILREIVMPRAAFDRAWYRKVGTRRATTLSKVSFAGVARRRGKGLVDVRMALGAVAPTVVRSREIEGLMTGWNRDDIAGGLAGIIEGYDRLLEPIEDQRSSAKYRRAVSLRLIEHFLMEEIS
jgi:CO/xanthine dehydrogenase FAD-binding subunit